MDIINNSEIKSLEELASEDCRILFDTSAIINPLGKGRKYFDFKAVREKADFKEQNNNFLRDVTSYIINKGNFFVTGYVLEEISNYPNYDYKKIIKKEGHCRDKELLRLRRMIKKEEQNKRRMVNAFIDNNKLVVLEDEMKKLYERISEKYQGLKEKYKLSDTDFDFLLTGITFAMASVPVIFVSNDYKIFYARNKILRGNCLEEHDVRFFTRVDFFKFNPLRFFNKIPKI